MDPGLLVVGSCVPGSVSAGHLVVRLLSGEDIRGLGSGNDGAAGVLWAGLRQRESLRRLAAGSERKLGGEVGP